MYLESICTTSLDSNQTRWKIQVRGVGIFVERMYININPGFLFSLSYSVLGVFM